MDNKSKALIITPFSLSELAGKIADRLRADNMEVIYVDAGAFRKTENAVSELLLKLKFGGNSEPKPEYFRRITIKGKKNIRFEKMENLLARYSPNYIIFLSEHGIKEAVAARVKSGDGVKLICVSEGPIPYGMVNPFVDFYYVAGSAEKTALANRYIPENRIKLFGENM